MLKKIINSLDKKIAKPCLYAAVTVVLTIVLLWLLYMTGGFWARLWLIFTAVLKPVVIGGIISFLLSPLVDTFENHFNRKKKHKWARYIAILLSFLIILAILALIIVIIILTIYKNVSAINLETVAGLGDLVQEDTENLVDAIEQLAIKDIVTGLFFGIIFSIYFMIDDGGIKRYWVRAFTLITGKKNEERAKQFWHDTENIFSGYLRGQFIDASIVCVITGVVFLIEGIPEGLLIALLVGIGNLIPYVGPIVGYCAVVIVCLPQGEYQKMVLGLVSLLIIMFVDGNIINPRLLSNNIKIHPLLVVAALIGGGAIGGFVGMLVAVPVSALIKLYFDRYLDQKERDFNNNIQN